MALLIDLIVGAVGDFLGGLGNDLLKDTQKRAAFAKCLGAALEAVKARYAELVYTKFLDKIFFQQKTVVGELAKLLSRSGEPDIEVLFEQYRREWQNPDDAPPEGRAAIQLFVDELRKCLWSSPEFRQELDSQAFEKTAGAAEHSEILL